MALVNLDLGVGFIHVPRTGGTLFGHVLRFEYGFVDYGHEHCPIGHVVDDLRYGLRWFSFVRLGVLGGALSFIGADSFGVKIPHFQRTS